MICEEWNLEEETSWAKPFALCSLHRGGALGLCSIADPELMHFLVTA